MTIEELEKLEDLLACFGAEMMKGTSWQTIISAREIVNKQIKIEKKK